MAVFTGILKEFNVFIGPIACNLKKHTTCRHKGCNKRKSLEFPHVKGKQRPIIAEILSDYSLDNEDFHKVDSHEFKLKFMDAHTPIEEVILPVL